MVHAALLLLMLEAVTTDLVFTISLKRSTQNLQLSTSCRPITPSFGPKQTTADFGLPTICRLFTQSGHWLRIAAMAFEPLRCRRLGFGAEHAATRVYHASRRCGGSISARGA